MRCANGNAHWSARPPLERSAIAPADTAPTSAMDAAAPATNAFVRNELGTATPSSTVTAWTGRHSGRLAVQTPGGHEIARGTSVAFRRAGQATGVTLRP